MTRVHVGNHTYEIDGILFDKDGTLVDFRSLWLSWAKALVENVVVAARLTNEDENSLSKAIGFDMKGNGWDPEGPLCIGSIDDLMTILSFRLYEKEIPWNEAVELVTEIYIRLQKKMNWEEIVKPIKGLIPFLHKAEKHKLKLGVVTSDNQDQAIGHLAALQIGNFFNSVIGHDQVERGKPFPDMVEKACGQLQLHPNRALIIGDSNGDMMLGENADMLGRIGIVSDGNQSADHLVNADHIIKSYDDLVIDA